MIYEVFHQLLRYSDGDSNKIDSLTPEDFQLILQGLSDGDLPPAGSDAFLEQECTAG
ncbi:MAG TPA: hypothetical protein IAA21_03655 [Candidatus Blautia faecigallinarum]|uniref:Uncharacterized protein n=1 Tax=Candidatus Blautia faecigallinarum TaxID=2838488 RepID=A0A9D2DRW0_9FIRM|nr:hypothetical protein [Candidatus Blautia faecigallinarum]